MADKEKSMLKELEDQLKEKEDTRQREIDDQLNKNEERELQELEDQLADTEKARLEEIEQKVEAETSKRMGELEERLYEEEEYKLKEIDKKVQKAEKKKLKELDSKIREAEETRTDEMEAKVAEKETKLQNKKKAVEDKVKAQKRQLNQKRGALFIIGIIIAILAVASIWNNIMVMNPENSGEPNVVSESSVTSNNDPKPDTVIENVEKTLNKIPDLTEEEKKAEKIKENIERLKQENSCVKCFLRGAYLSGHKFSKGTNLSGANLSDANLSNVMLKDSNLSDTNLSSANLMNADLNHSNLSGADFSSAILNNAKLKFTNLTETRFRRSYLIGTELSGADLKGADFIKADLAGAIIKSVANCNTAEFEGANLKGADFGQGSQCQVSSKNSLKPSTIHFRSGNKTLNEPEKENVWTVNTRGRWFIASVNGLKTHGDRLRIGFPTKQCKYANTSTTFKTTRNHPEIKTLKNKMVAAIFKGDQVYFTIPYTNEVYISKVLAWYSVSVDFGSNTLPDIKKFFKNQNEVSLVLKDFEKLKVSDYFFKEELSNSWSLKGLEGALDRAQQECYKLSKPSN